MLLPLRIGIVRLHTHAMTIGMLCYEHIYTALHNMFNAEHVIYLNPQKRLKLNPSKIFIIPSLKVGDLILNTLKSSIF